MQMIVNAIFYLLTNTILFYQFTTSDSFSGCKKNNETSFLSKDSVLFQKLLQVDKKKFLGLTVDSFLKNETLPAYKSHTFMVEPRCLLVSYAKNLSIKIFVSNYQYVNEFEDPMRWNFSDFKKDKISKLRLIFYGNIVEEISTTPIREPRYEEVYDSVKMKSHNYLHCP